MAFLENERCTELRQARVRLDEIKATLFTDSHPVDSLECCVTGPGRQPERAPRRRWKPFLVGHRWGGLDQVHWFRMRVIVPKAMKGKRVVALVRPGGQSVAFVDGQPRLGLDPNHDMILLTKSARGGERFEITTESLVNVRYDRYEDFQYADIAVMQPHIWEFWWDCSVAADLVAHLPEAFAPRRRLHDLLVRAIEQVDLQHIGTPQYDASIRRAHRLFQETRAALPASEGFGRLALVGQSHLDTAWLWPLRETWRKCGRTFANALDLLDRYPDFRFMATQPVQYEMTRRHFPELYKRIKKYVRQGRWEVMGGAWVEPDCNLPSGESLVRQFLYGNRFFRKEFGIHTRTAWLPDTFGETWALPQILRKAQIDTFATVKVAGGPYQEFPYGLFHWQGPDGSQVLAYMPNSAYNGFMEIPELTQKWTTFKQNERVTEIPHTIGYGDGGGGPSQEMIEVARRVENVPGMPRCRFQFMQDTIDQMRSEIDAPLPVWNGELYAQFHRGCQTSQARTKRNNRKCEVMLHDAEFLSSLALTLGGPYDAGTLCEAWKAVLTNQFHDILPGSSIHEVYTDADRDYAEAFRLIRTVRDGALAFLLTSVQTAGEGQPLVVFNTLGFPRRTVARVRAALPKTAFHVVGPDGTVVASQRVGEDELVFETGELPSMGFAVYRILPGEAPVARNPLKASPRRLENAFLRVRMDARGRLTEVFDKGAGRQVLAQGRRGNVLQFFDDRPADSNAWDIDHNFENTAWGPGPAESIEVLEAGPVRAVVRVRHRVEQTLIQQDIVLHADSPRIDFETSVDWQHRQTLLKVAFPVEVSATRAHYETAFASVDRPTHANMPFDRARFEVPAHRWADVSEGNYGVALLNDCKYGYDVRGGVMRLSLLRAPIYPDPTADQGRHEFTYALYPHPGDWRTGVVRQGLDLNVPPIACATEAGEEGELTPGAFFSVDVPHVVLDTVKKHEDSKALILRMYEAHGQRGEVVLTLPGTPQTVTECDLMEEGDLPVRFTGNTVRFRVKPYEIRTFKIRL
jgi:alpha-mannosidase